MLDHSASYPPPPDFLRILHCHAEEIQFLKSNEESSDALPPSGFLKSPWKFHIMSKI